jgi:hypothetical protein
MIPDRDIWLAALRLILQQRYRAAAKVSPE